MEQGVELSQEKRLSAYLQQFPRISSQFPRIPADLSLNPLFRQEQGQYLTLN